MNFLAWTSGAGLVLWIVILALPWRPWSTRERLEPESGRSLPAHRAEGISVLIPARNEAAHIGACLDSILAQGPGLDVVVVDDRSEDATGEIARSRPAVRVIDGQDSPPGWSGKLWAQQQGLEAIDRPLVLLVDADIELAPGMLAALVAKLETEDRALVSIMARLPAAGFWEKLLLPAFVYFFKLLYPFALVNRSASRIAAAAGGCVLVRRSCLEQAGAFSAWKDALIDDCELAARIKPSGAIWLGLSRSVTSLRRHPDLASIWETVTRTAFTQLRYSPVLLLAVTVVMAGMFLGPLTGLAAGLAGGAPAVAWSGAGALVAMLAGYFPMIRFYRLHPAWAAGLALAGPLFLAMTWHSAILHWTGRGAGWKGRRYAKR